MEKNGEDIAKDPPQTFRIGCALSQRKQLLILRPSLLSLAQRHSLSLVPIDPDLPLDSQGPFHLVLHKLYHPAWTSNLLSYAAKNPNVPIVDHPSAIACLHNRVSMLEAASRLRFLHREEVVGVPRQIVVEDWGTGLDLEFPVIAKPLVADGGAGTHDLALVFRNEGLLKLKLPVVLQDFVNHGGVLFKVYVIGDYVTCVKRRSLPDVSVEGLKCEEGLVPFSQVSNTPSQDNQIEQQLESAVMPSLVFVEDIARGLRESTGLRLFNFDLIRDAKVENRYLVIDINYFPGYEKIPSFEEVFTKFLLNIVHGNLNHD